MKKVITCFLVSWCSLQVFSQHPVAIDTVRAIVVDAVSGQPLPGAWVSIRDSLAKKELKTMFTDETGKFVFQGTALSKKHLSIVITYVGYELKQLNIDPDASKEIGVIQLSPLSIQLTDVRITAKRALVQQEIDRLSYDVQADPENKAQSVLDMLRKVPLLSIDGDDNIRLKGSGNYRILINGRPSSLVARNPQEAFKAMPAGSIQKIEVITTPPAKYDGEGLAGIINIITIKKTGDGYFASLGIRYNSVNGIAENASLTSKIGRFAITGSGNLYQNFQRRTGLAYTRSDHATSQLLDQTGNSTYQGTFSNAKLEVSYDVDSLSMITLSLGLFGNNNTVDVLQRSQLFSTSTILEGYRLFNKGENHSSGFDMDANYQVGFRKNKGQLLTLSYNQVYFPNENKNQISMDDRIHYIAPDFNQSNHNGTRENTVQADFTKPVGKAGFDLGGKVILRNSYSDFITRVYDNAAKEYQRDPARSNRFSYHQDVYSFYHSWYGKLRAAELRAGMRLEHTQVNANFETQKNTVRQSYTHFIPSVSLQHHLSDIESLVFGFTQRIYRPGIWMLNPFVNRSNPRIVSSGNPELKAVLNNNFELIYTRAGKATFSMGLSYLFANNMVQTVTVIRDTVSYSTTQNGGKYRNLQLNTSLNHSFSSNATLSLNGQVAYISSKGIYKGNDIKNNGIETNITANFAYKISDSWRFNFNNGFIGPYILLQGRTNSVYSSSFNLTWLLFDKKLVVAAGLNNPYQKFRYAKTYIETPDFSQLNNLQRNYRSINVSATWNLGSLKSQVRKTSRKIVNDDTRQ